MVILLLVINSSARPEIEAQPHEPLRVPHCRRLKKGDRVLNLITPSSTANSCNLLLRASSNFVLLRTFSPTMATSHSHLFQSIMDESEIRKLIANHFLPDHVVLRWCPVIGEDIQTPNTTEFVVLSS
jgi:hypothetical protein